MLFRWALPDYDLTAPPPCRLSTRIMTVFTLSYNPWLTSKEKIRWTQESSNWGQIQGPVLFHYSLSSCHEFNIWLHLLKNPLFSWITRLFNEVQPCDERALVPNRSHVQFNFPLLFNFPSQWLWSPCLKHGGNHDSASPICWLTLKSAFQFTVHAILGRHRISFISAVPLSINATQPLREP